MSQPVIIRIDPKYINFLNQIMEGYEYLGVASTIDRGQGTVIIRATPDTVGEVREILDNLPVKIEYLQK